MEGLAVVLGILAVITLAVLPIVTFVLVLNVRRDQNRQGAQLARLLDSTAPAAPVPSPVPAMPSAATPAAAPSVPQPPPPLAPRPAPVPPAMPPPADKCRQLLADEVYITLQDAPAPPPGADGGGPFQLFTLL